MTTINLNAEQVDTIKSLLNESPEGKHVLAILGL